MKHTHKLIALALLSASPAFAQGVPTTGNTDYVKIGIGAVAVAVIVFAILHVRKKNKENKD
jgi:hypothetical protein